VDVLDDGPQLLLALHERVVVLVQQVERNLVVKQVFYRSFAELGVILDEVFLKIFGVVQLEIEDGAMALAQLGFVEWHHSVVELRVDLLQDKPEVFQAVASSKDVLSVFVDGL